MILFFFFFIKRKSRNLGLGSKRRDEGGKQNKSSGSVSFVPKLCRLYILNSKLLYLRGLCSLSVSVKIIRVDTCLLRFYEQLSRYFVIRRVPVSLI